MSRYKFDYGTGDCSVSVSGGGDTMRTRTMLYLHKTLYQTMHLRSAVMQRGNVVVETLIFGAQLLPTPHSAVPEVAVK